MIYTNLNQTEKSEGKLVNFSVKFSSIKRLSCVLNYIFLIFLLVLMSLVLERTRDKVGFRFVVIFSKIKVGFPVSIFLPSPIQILKFH